MAKKGNKLRKRATNGEEGHSEGGRHEPLLRVQEYADETAASSGRFIRPVCIHLERMS